MVTAVAPTAATPGRDGAAREATKVVPMPGSSRRCQCLGSGASVQAHRQETAKPMPTREG